MVSTDIYHCVATIILKFNDCNNLLYKYSTRRITMIDFFKKLFGSAVKIPADAPYKVEAPTEAPVSEAAMPFPAPKPTEKPAKKTATKSATKPATKTRKPKTAKS